MHQCICAVPDLYTFPGARAACMGLNLLFRRFAISAKSAKGMCLRLLVWCCSYLEHAGMQVPPAAAPASAAGDSATDEGSGGGSSNSTAPLTTAPPTTTGLTNSAAAQLQEQLVCLKLMHDCPFHEVVPACWHMYVLNLFVAKNGENEGWTSLH